MLNKFDFVAFESPYADEKRGDLGEKLAELQRVCSERNIPVIIMIDGWESSGKAMVLNDLVRELDTKMYRVHEFEDLSKEDTDRIFTWRFWRRMPAKGDFSIFDRSMYYRLLNTLDEKSSVEREHIKDIARLEKLLSDDHTILIKFFLHQSEKMLKHAIAELEDDPNRKFLVSDLDLKQRKHYNDYYNHFSTILELTDFPYAHWNIVSAEDRKVASKHILGTTIELVQEGLDEIERRKDRESVCVDDYELQSHILRDLDLSPVLDDDDYDEQIDTLQKEAQELTYALQTKKIPTVLAFEGVDAAGKGGSIQRLREKIDARLYDVNPTSAPNDMEKDHHYLWRFYNNLPEDGKMAIFDRSWYGRLMVERVEKFATVCEWTRAYGEINDMEREWTDQGILVLKFFLMISKDEQLKRFEDRQKEKPYKITDEDWRNREKWDAYLDAMEEMLERTNKENAPWIIISSEDKKHARVEVLKAFNSAAKKRLALEDEDKKSKDDDTSKDDKKEKEKKSEDKSKKSSGKEEKKDKDEKKKKDKKKDKDDKKKDKKKKDKDKDKKKDIDDDKKEKGRDKEEKDDDKEANDKK